MNKLEQVENCAGEWGNSGEERGIGQCSLCGAHAFHLHHYHCPLMTHDEPPPSWWVKHWESGEDLNYGTQGYQPSPSSIDNSLKGVNSI
jgi:hypothetical protein